MTTSHQRSELFPDDPITREIYESFADDSDFRKELGSHVVRSEVNLHGNPRTEIEDTASSEKGEK